MRPSTPFGGFKRSGFGRELGMHGLAGYSEIKNVFYSTEMMAGRLEGKVCVITGAGGGMGADAAVRFAEEGALVVVADVDGAAAEQVAGEVGGLPVQVDVSDEASVEAMYAAAAERFGGIDVLYNNAGISPPTTPRSSRPISTPGNACRP